MAAESAAAAGAMDSGASDDTPVDSSGASPAVSSRDRGPAPTVADWLLVGGICLFGAFAAGMAFFYLPWFIGPVPMPITVLGVGWLCWALPRTAYRLTGSMAAAVLPAMVVFGVILVLLLIPNSLDLQRPPRVIDDPPFDGQADGTSWRNLALLGVPALAAAAALALLWGDRVAARNVTAVTSGASDASATDVPGDTGKT